MRKVLSMLLALVMLLTPVLGLAASPAELLDAAWNAGCTVSTRVSFEMADLPIPEDLESILQDMVKALGFRTAANPAGKAEAALTLQGQDALAIGFEPAGDELYLDLPLLAPQTIAFNSEELLTTVERLVLMAVEASGGSQSDLEQVKAFFDSGLEVAAEGMLESVETMDIQMPEIDLDAMLEMLMNTATMNENPVQPADCDPVMAAVTLNITPELVEMLMKALCDILEANPSLMASMAQADMAIEPEKLKEAPAAAAQEFKAEYGVVPATLMLNEAGEIVYGDVVFTPVAGGVVSVISFARKTLEKGVQYGLSYTDDGEGICIQLVDSCGENKTEYGLSLYEVVNGQKQGMLLDGGLSQIRDRNDQKAHDVTTLFAIIPTGDSEPASVTAVLTIDQQAEALGNGAQCNTAVSLGLDLLGGDFFTINVNTVADDAKLPSLVTDTPVRPGAMTEEEFAGFVEAVPNNAMTTVFTALQMLPESVLMLMMSE